MEIIEMDKGTTQHLIQYIYINNQKVQLLSEDKLVFKASKAYDTEPTIVINKEEMLWDTINLGYVITLTPEHTQDIDMANRKSIDLLFEVLCTSKLLDLEVTEKLAKGVIQLGNSLEVVK